MNRLSFSYFFLTPSNSSYPILRPNSAKKQFFQTYINELYGEHNVDLEK